MPFSNRLTILGPFLVMVILADDLQVLVPSAGLRHDHGRQLAQVQHCRGIERIAVHSDYLLLIDRRREPNVKPGTQAYYVNCFFDRDIGFSGHS